MKTIRLNPQQRKDISERRRHAQDRRIYQRLSAVLWSDDGRTREEIADLLGVSTRQVGQWFRIFRNKGLEQLCTLHYRGDPGRLRPAQVQRPGISRCQYCGDGSVLVPLVRIFSHCRRRRAASSRAVDT